MIRKAILSILSLFLILSGSCAAVEIIPAEDHDNSFYQKTIDFSATNPEWGCIIISENQYFQGPCNTLSNYKFDIDGTLILYDVETESTMKVIDPDRVLYYHVFENGETVPLYSDYLTDNVLFMR